MDKYKIQAWIGILFTLFSCAELDERVDKTIKKGFVKFNFSTISSSVEEDGSLTRSVIDNSKNITQLWCTILDSKENVIRSYHLIGEQTKMFYMEDVEAGKYSAIFMATTEDIPMDTNMPNDIAAAWITNPMPNKPFEQDYLYKRVDFTVHPDDSSQTLDIKLPRLIGRVEVQIESSNKLIQQLIKKIEIVFDNESNINTALLGSGVYTGSSVLDKIDITQDRGFFSLPGENLSGKVLIEQQTSFENPEIFTTEFSFKALNIVPGTISTVTLKYSHPEDIYGEIKISESSYNVSNSTTMFLNSEPSSVINSRTFKVNSPLDVAIDTQHKQLVTRFFAPVELKDTKILIKFKRYSSKFFYLAHYDVIQPFQESRMDIPVMSRSCKFIAEDGEQVWIPVQEDLSEKNCELKIYSENEYISKIQNIKCRWTFRFEEGHFNPPYRILDPSPELARHLCVVAVNMGYMFSCDYFKSKHDELEGLYDNDRIPIDKDFLLKKILNKDQLKLGILDNNPTAQGLGGPYVTMLADHFRRHYPIDNDPSPGTNLPRRTLFHEFGHFLGYHHGSNMTRDEVTQDDRWPQFCSRIYYELCITKEMPVSTNVIESLPR